MNLVPPNPSAVQLKASEVVARTRVQKSVFVSLRSLKHLPGFYILIRPLEEPRVKSIGEKMIREGFRPHEPIIFVESVHEVEGVPHYIPRYILCGNHRCCAARESGMDFVRGLVISRKAVLSLLDLIITEERNDKVYSSDTSNCVRRLYRCYKQLALSIQAREPSPKDLTPLQQVNFLRGHMRNDPELGLPHASDRANFSKLLGGWKRIRKRVFPHEADHNDSRVHFLLNGTKGEGKGRAMNKVFRGALHLMVAKLEPAIPFLCSQTVLDLLCYWESNKSFVKFGETHIMYAGELTPHELSEVVMETYNDWSSSGGIPFRSVLNRLLVDAKKAQRQQPQLELAERRMKTPHVRYDEDDETLDDKDEDAIDVLPSFRKKKRKKPSQRSNQKRKHKVRKISHQIAEPTPPNDEERETVSDEQIHGEHDEVERSVSNSVSGLQLEPNNTQLEDIDDEGSRVRPEPIDAQLPSTAHTSQEPALLEEPENGATGKPQMALIRVDETDQPALSEIIRKKLPLTANQERGQRKEPQMAQAASLEIIDDLEKTLADVSGTKEEELQKAVEEAKKEMEKEFRARRAQELDELVQAESKKLVAQQMNEYSARQAEHMRQWKSSEREKLRKEIRAELSKDTNEENVQDSRASRFRIPSRQVMMTTDITVIEEAIAKMQDVLKEKRGKD